MIPILFRWTDYRGDHSADVDTIEMRPETTTIAELLADLNKRRGQHHVSFVIVPVETLPKEDK